MTDWTDDRIEILRVGVYGGLSFAQIARTVGDGCTRCAALGKASRMGFVQPGQASRPIVRATRPPIRGEPYRPPAPKLAGRVAVFEEALAREPRVWIPERTEQPGACTILDLGAYMCRWPIGDPADARFTFCGKRAPDGPYCATHRERAYQPAQAKKRAGTDELARSLRRYI